MENYIAAIDLGTTKVVTLIGQRSSGGKVHVLAASETPSLGILRGEVLNIRQVTESIQNTVKDIREKSGIDVREVFAGIAGQHIRCIENSVGNMRENEEEEISEHEIEEMKQQMYHIGIEPDEKILDVIPQSYTVDEHVNIPDPAGYTGKGLKGYYRIFIGKSRWATNTEQCIRRAGLELNLKQFVLEPLASAMAVLSDDEKEMGVAMVDIGGGTTGLTVYYDHIVRHTAIIPFGGNVISEDIRQGCAVRLSQANAIKEQIGSCFGDMVDNSLLVIPGINGQEREISFRYLAGIIGARMEEIIEAVMHEIDSSGYADRLQAGIVFTGGGAMMQHLVELAHIKTGYAARIAKPLHITDDSPAEVRRCSYATAVGLLLAGMKYKKQPEQLSIPVPAPEPEPVEIPLQEAAPPRGRKRKEAKEVKGPKKKPILDYWVGRLFPDDSY
ncbi:MAG: cell division protein FtsA [Prevotellaceae bacterium]|jgi:cell division protein FtsA|nr:cell division protein FtsA [Prevotellaceae bacterium]